MRSALLIAVLLVASTSLSAAELNWQSNYGEALKLARTSARPLLVVLSGEAGLPMTAAATEDAPTADGVTADQEILDRYVVCKIDPSSEYGTRIAAAFRVSEFPHSVIIDKTAKKILFSKAGTFTQQTWQTTLTKYQAGTVQPPVQEVQIQPRVQQSNDQLQSRFFTRRNSFRRPVYCST